jgi:hypothetical protein
LRKPKFTRHDDFRLLAFAQLRQLLGELVLITQFLESCWGQLYEAMKRQEATGVPDPDLKSVLARVEQSADKANEVTLKVRRLLPSLHRKRLRPPARPKTGCLVHILGMTTVL